MTTVMAGDDAQIWARINENMAAAKEAAKTPDAQLLLGILAPGQAFEAREPEPGFRIFGVVLAPDALQPAPPSGVTPASERQSVRLRIPGESFWGIAITPTVARVDNFPLCDDLRFGDIVGHEDGAVRAVLLRQFRDDLEPGQMTAVLWRSPQPMNCADCGAESEVAQCATCKADEGVYGPNRGPIDRPAKSDA